MGTRVPRNTGVPPRMSGSLIMTPMKGLYHVGGKRAVQGQMATQSRFYGNEEKRDFIPQKCAGWRRVLTSAGRPHRRSDAERKASASRVRNDGVGRHGVPARMRGGLRRLQSGSR